MNDPHFFHAITDADDGLYECLDCRVLYEPPPTDIPEVQAMPALDQLEDDVIRDRIQVLAAAHDLVDPTLAQLGLRNVDGTLPGGDELHGWLIAALAATAADLATARLLALAEDTDGIPDLLSSTQQVLTQVDRIYRAAGPDADLQQFIDQVALYATAAADDISTVLGLT